MGLLGQIVLATWCRSIESLALCLSYLGSHARSRKFGVVQYLAGLKKVKELSLMPPWPCICRSHMELGARDEPGLCTPGVLKSKASSQDPAGKYLV